MSREEAAAEIEAGGRRKEIADEAIRETACVDAEKLKPPFHEKWKNKQSGLDRKIGAFLFYGNRKQESPTRVTPVFDSVKFCL